MIVSSARRVVIGIALLMLSVGVSASVSAQPTPNDENVQAVLQAFATTRHTGYHFYSKAVTSNIYTAADGSTQSEYIGLEQEGDVSANDDSQQTTRLTVGSSLETMRSFKPLTLDCVAYDGEIYVYLDPNDSWSISIFGVSAGWWRFDEFRSHLTYPDVRQVIDETISYGGPADAITNAKSILSVSYTGTAHVGSREMRDYNLQNNVLRTVLRSLPGEGSEHLANILNYAPLLLSSRLSLSLLVQVGADDGLLYHMAMDSRRGLPYLSAGYASSFPYDIENDSLADTTYSYPFKPVVITPPDSNLLNH